MNGFLLYDLNIDTLQRMFEELKKILHCWEFPVNPEKIQREDSINYLCYIIVL